MRRFFALFLIGLIIVLLPTLVLALSPEKVAEIALDVTVVIDSCDGGGAGSGIIYKKEGNGYYVLTANHVVKGSTICSVLTPEDESPIVKRENMTIPIKGIDLAILRFTSDKSYKLAKFGDSDELKPQQEIYVVGAPQSTPLKPKRAILPKNGRFFNQQLPNQAGYDLIYNVPTEKGMSGGGVFNTDGKVVGIHGQNDDNTGDKLGISSKSFLSQVDVRIDETQPENNQPFLWLLRKLWIGLIFLLIFFIVWMLIQQFPLFQVSQKFPSPSKVEVKPKSPPASQVEVKPKSPPASKEELKEINSNYTETLPKGIELEMVAIPAGKFMMGSNEYDDEKPIHEVTLKAFYMAKYLITQAQWKAVAQLPQIERELKESPSRFKGENLPIERVTWDDAVEFCARLKKYTNKNYQLPSEAQWEYACRAGTTTPFYFGETLSDELANYDANYTYGNGKKGKYRQQTTPVGSFPPNGFGLYDMHGNVWEWCADNWHDNYNNASTDGSVWIDKSSSIYVIRGGSWLSYPYICRSACRLNDLAREIDYNIGFRVVCS